MRALSNWSLRRGVNLPLLEKGQSLVGREKHAEVPFGVTYVGGTLVYLRALYGLDTGLNTGDTASSYGAKASRQSQWARIRAQREV